MELSDEQRNVCEQVVNGGKESWFRCYGTNVKPPRDNILTIGGHAGTGKTYLISGLAKSIKKRFGKRYSIAFCTYTGKAASILKTCITKTDILTSFDYVGTIHGLIYRPKYMIGTNGKKIISGWVLKPEIESDIIIIDEASMVNNEIFNDLIGYGKPIIAVGDHGQLPPIGDRFNLMKNPKHVLKIIHRQVEDNPIIKLSSFVRHYGYVKPGIYNSKNEQKIFKLSWNDPRTKKMFSDINWDSNYIVLCGFNQTRVELNNLIRNKLGNKLPEPYPNERLICLKNNHNTKIMNGQIGTLVWFTYASPKVYDMTIKIDGSSNLYSNLVHNCCFGQVSYENGYDNTTYKKHKTLFKRTKYNSIDLFDFGYVISVHRSQGSEWDNVVLFEQRSKYWDDEFFRRWLYTAVTRARKNLFIIYDY